MPSFPGHAEADWLWRSPASLRSKRWESLPRAQLPAVLLFRPTSGPQYAIAPVSFSDHGQPRKQLILEENPKYFLNARHRGTAPAVACHKMCRPSWQSIPFDALAHQLSIQPGHQSLSVRHAASSMRSRALGAGQGD